MGIYNPMRAEPRSSQRKAIPLTRVVFASGGRLLGPRGRARLSRQINKFLIFIVIFKQNVAKLWSLWRSAPAKPRKHVGHGAQANPSGIRLWRPALGASRARAPEPPNGQILIIYRYFRPKCRHIVEFMAFRACQTPQARRPRRTSQAQTVGEFW